MQQDNKLSNIVILVHPLFDLVNEAIEKNIGSDLERLNNILYNLKNTEDLLRLEKQILNFVKTNKYMQVKYKKCLAEYGKKIIECKKNPNTLVVLFKSYNPINVNKILQLNSNYKLSKDEILILKKKYEKAEMLFESVYNRLLLNYVVFLEREIPKNRLFISDFFFETKRVLPRSILKRLNKNLSITVFGEYAHRCVSQWGRSIYNQVKRGRSVKYTELLESSISAEKELVTKEFNKRFLFGHKRREQREREKKQKLRQKRCFIK